jgi:RHS repeat-associated protein
VINSVISTSRESISGNQHDDIKEIVDSLGSVITLSNTSGNAVERYEYDVFGQCTVHTGPGNDGIWMTSDDPLATASAKGNPYLFTGRNYDSETGLYYYRARYYKPSIGRFLQTDPIGYADRLNLYAYCQNNPVMNTDPNGLVVLKCPPKESDAKCDNGLCYDWANPVHPGQRCYREVIPPGSGDTEPGIPYGLHCCYKGGKLVDSHIDPTDPAIGGGGGYCKYGFWSGRLQKHWREIIIIKIFG